MCFASAGGCRYVSCPDQIIRSGKLRFIYQLAGDMLRHQGKAQHAESCMLNLVRDIFFVRGEFIAQLPADLQGTGMIFNNFNTAEDNDAPDIQRPLAILPIALIEDAERGFVMTPDCINLVAGDAAVKINLSVFRAVIMVNRHAVGIVIVSENREDTTQLIFEKLNAFFPGKLLFDSCYFSKHGKLLPDGRSVRQLYFCDQILNCLLQVFVEPGKMNAVN